MNKIRKISIGKDLKEAIHYHIGGKGAKGTIHEITFEDIWFSIYIIEGNVIQLWKKVNVNMGIAVEFDID